jgi:hypothetical protein
MIAGWLRARLPRASAPAPSLEEAERHQRENRARLEKLAAAAAARRRAIEIQQDIIARRRHQS